MFMNKTFLQLLLCRMRFFLHFYAVCHSSLNNTNYYYDRKVKKVQCTIEVNQKLQKIRLYDASKFVFFFYEL